MTILFGPMLPARLVPDRPRGLKPPHNWVICVLLQDGWRADLVVGRRLARHDSPVRDETLAGCEARGRADLVVFGGLSVLDADTAGVDVVTPLLVGPAGTWL